MSERVGAGSYAVTVTEPSGRMVWQSTPRDFASVSWSRERCEVSKADLKATIDPAIMNRIEPWVHLLSVYRDDVLVWHGIITKTTALGTSVTIEASDGSVFFSRRRIAISRWWGQTDATQVMRTMVEDACGFADHTGIVDSMVTRESRLWVTSGWEASSGMLTDVISKLVDQGLVWTVASGRLLIGPIAATHTTAQLSDSSFDGNMMIVKDGTNVVTDALVTGQGVWGQWGDPYTPVGLVQSISKADGAARAEECRQQAEREVRDGMVAPRRLEVPGGSRLMPTVPVTVAELVPGVQVPVSTRQTGIVMSSTMQLTKVDVTADSKGESVKVTLGEPTVTDRVAELPDPADLDWRSPYEKEKSKNEKSGAGSAAGSSESQDQVGIPPA